MQTAPKKVLRSWAMYDWANSVYSLVITSTIFPAYFESITRGNPTANGQSAVRFLGREFSNTALYNYALAVAFLVVALLSPFLSSLADCRGNKKSFMRFFLTLGSVACVGLFWFDSSSRLGIGLLAMVIACIGYWGSLVFYNAFLPEIAAYEDRDRVSARGFAMGYIGSVILQVICFVFVFNPGWVGGNDDSTIQYRLCFLLVGIWWFGFGLLSLRRLPDSIPTGSTDKNIWAQGYRELGKVWNQLMHTQVLKRFLFAFFFYNMGVQTVMLAATLYGKSELNIPTSNLIIAILLIQLIAIPGAFAISRLSKAIGNLQALAVCILIWTGICIAGYYMPPGNVMAFYGLAVVVGFVMGGIQSLSRSTYSKLMPETRDTTSFFSFYDVTEKIAIVIGMFSFGYITELTGSQRNSVLTLMVFFLIGLTGILLAIQTQKNKSY